MLRLITTVLLDTDVELNGESRNLGLSQENIEHLICPTKQPPRLYLVLTYELIAGVILLFSKGVSLTAVSLIKSHAVCFILQTAGGGPIEAPTFFVFFLLLPHSLTPPSLPLFFCFFF